jgi:hypothetical protein
LLLVTCEPFSVITRGLLREWLFEPLTGLFVMLFNSRELYGLMHTAQYLCCYWSPLPCRPIIVDGYHLWVPVSALVGSLPAAYCGPSCALLLRGAYL